MRDSLGRNHAELVQALASGQERVWRLMDEKLAELRQSTDQKLAEIQKTVNEQLHQAVEQQMAASFSRVTEQFALVQKAMGDVQAVTAQISDIKRIFSNVRTRGGWGETQLRALMVEVRRHLPEITVPLLLIYSKADQTVPFGNMQMIAEQVRSTDLVQKTLERSDHVLTQEIEREAVYEMVWEFLSARLE